MTQTLTRWLTAGLVALLLGGCDTTTQPGALSVEERASAPSPAAEPTAGRWTRLPDSPLSPRESSTAAYVTTPGTELVVVVGGHTGPPCPPAADCVFAPGSYARDGAAYDVEAGTWRRIAEPPRALGLQPATAVVGSTLYVLTRRHLLAWDAARDAWTELARPAGTGWGQLAADLHGPRPRLVVTGDDSRHPDQAYDPATDTWSRLPADPLGPSFDRVLTPTSRGLVLTAKPLAADGDLEDPSFVRAAVLGHGTTSWRELPAEGELIGGWRWTWTGERLVDPSPGGADGGQVNSYGRVLPYGGALDPATGRWASLDDTPKSWTGGWPVEALGGRVSAVEGWIYDDGVAGRGSSWTRVPRPRGAPEEPGAAVWAGDLLVVVGGSDWTLQKVGRAEPEDVWSTGVWAYRMDAAD